MASLFVRRLLQNQSPQDDEELRRQAMIASQGMRGELGDAPPITSRGPMAGDASDLSANTPVPSVPQSVPPGWHPPMAADYVPSQAQVTPQPAPQNPTTPEQAAMTRPRTVAPQPEMSNPDATRTRFNDPVRLTESGRPELRPYDYGANPLDSAVAFENAANSAEIHGHGFKNRMKSGLLNALSAAPQERAAAFVQGVAAPNLIRKKLTQADATQNLGQQLGIAREQAQLANMGQVPVTLANGTTVYTTKAHAADLISRQQGVVSTNNRVSELGRDRGMQRYNQLESYDPDDPNDAGLKKYFESSGLTGLPAKDKYHRPTITWANGNLLITDAGGTRQAEVNGAPVSDVGRTPNAQGLTPNQAAANTRGVNAEAGRNARSAAQIRAANQRAANLIGATNDRQRNQIISQISRMGDPDEMNGSADALVKQANATTDPVTKDKIMAQAMKLREAAQKADAARKGMPGQPSTTPTPAPVKLTTDGFIKRFQQKRRRAPTAAEIAAFEQEHPQ